MKYGICTKCGEFGNVRFHHAKGYLGENKDNVFLYCVSCDKKVHIKARKEGKCNLSSKETKKLSTNSCLRRTRKILNIDNTTISPSIRLSEKIVYNINTGKVYCSTAFHPSNGKKLFYIDIHEGD